MPHHLAFISHLLAGLGALAKKLYKGAKLAAQNALHGFLAVLYPAAVLLLLESQMLQHPARQCLRGVHALQFSFQRCALAGGEKLHQSRLQRQHGGGVRQHPPQVGQVKARLLARQSLQCPGGGLLPAHQGLQLLRVGNALHAGLIGLQIAHDMPVEMVA